MRQTLKLESVGEKWIWKKRDTINCLIGKTDHQTFHEGSSREWRIWWGPYKGMWQWCRLPKFQFWSKLDWSKFDTRNTRWRTNFSRRSDAFCHAQIGHQPSQHETKCDLPIPTFRCIDVRWNIQGFAVPEVLSRAAKLFEDWFKEASLECYRKHSNRAFTLHSVLMT